VTVDSRASPLPTARGPVCPPWPSPRPRASVGAAVVAARAPEEGSAPVVRHRRHVRRLRSPRRRAHRRADRGGAGSSATAEATSASVGDMLLIGSRDRTPSRRCSGGEGQATPAGRRRWHVDDRRGRSRRGGGRTSVAGPGVEDPIGAPGARGREDPRSVPFAVNGARPRHPPPMLTGPPKAATGPADSKSAPHDHASAEYFLNT
jgi:hypothetical protein